MDTLRSNPIKKHLEWATGSQPPARTYSTVRGAESATTSALTTGTRLDNAEAPVPDPGCSSSSSGSAISGIERLEGSSSLESVVAEPVPNLDEQPGAVAAMPGAVEKTDEAFYMSHPVTIAGAVPTISSCRVYGEDRMQAKALQNRWRYKQHCLQADAWVNDRQFKPTAREAQTENKRRTWHLTKTQILGYWRLK